MSLEDEMDKELKTKSLLSRRIIPEPVAYEEPVFVRDDNSTVDVAVDETNVFLERDDTVIEPVVPLKGKIVTNSVESQASVQKKKSEQTKPGSGTETTAIMYSSLGQLLGEYTENSDRFDFQSDQKVLKAIRMTAGMADLGDVLVLLDRFEGHSLGIMIVTDGDVDNSDFLYYLMAGFVMNDPNRQRTRELKEEFFQRFVHMKRIEEISLSEGLHWKYAWSSKTDLIKKRNVKRKAV